MKNRIVGTILCAAVIFAGCFDSGKSQAKDMEKVAVLTPVETETISIDTVLSNALTLNEEKVVTLNINGGAMDIQNIFSLSNVTELKPEMDTVSFDALLGGNNQPMATELIFAEDINPNTETEVPAEEDTVSEEEVKEAEVPSVPEAPKDREESHRSVYVPKATITTHICGDFKESRTVFKSGIVLDYDLDEWINNEDEIDLLYRCVQSESGGEPSLGRRLVADCVLNMSRTKRISIKQAILNPGTFDVVSAGTIFTCTPSETTIECVNTELESQVDYGVMYFRTLHFHDFGVPYVQVGGHFFSKPTADVPDDWHE